MTTLTFDTLASANRMKEKGISPIHAEVFAMELKAASDVDFSHVATREEVQVFKSEMKADFVALDTKMKADFVALDTKINTVESSLKKDMQLMESHIINRLGAMLFALAVFIAGCIKYIGH